MTQDAVQATSPAGSGSILGKTGNFIRTATLSGRLAAGSGIVMSEGIVLGESGLTGVIPVSDASVLGEP